MMQGNRVPPASDGELSEIVDRVAERFPRSQGSLLPILHALQAELGYIPDAATPYLALALNISRAEVHGVITFYHDFRRKPAAAHIVKICRAEACQARGGAAIERSAAELLGAAMGTTRADGQLALEAVYCLGLCATGPNALVDGRPVSRLDAERLKAIAIEVGA